MKSNLLKPLLVTVFCAFVSIFEMNAQIVFYDFHVKNKALAYQGYGNHLYTKTKNTSDKTIRKATIRYVLIDRVGDVWKNQNGYYDLWLLYTGPLKPKRSSGKYCWTYVSPRQDLAAFPRYVYVQYMDGTTDAIQITEANIKTYFPNLKWQNVSYNNLAFDNTNPYDHVVAQNNSQNQSDSVQSDETPSASVPPVPVLADVDQQIPMTTGENRNVFAVVIGNEKYTQVAQVPHADNDAKIFAAYCEKTLGLPKQNIKLYENATYGTMIEAVSNIQKIANAYKGDIKVIFYYAGHGIPDEASKEAYLLPVDANGMRMEVCYPLSRLYSELAKMNTKNVTVFLDACFSGAQRGDGMLMAARGVAIKPKSNALTGNLVVFSAATGQQTAYPYKEKGHGMFTYYLLKKLSATRGECTLGELGSYVCDEVAKQAIVFNGKEQTPVVQTAPKMQNTWRNLKLK